MVFRLAALARDRFFWPAAAALLVTGTIFVACARPSPLLECPPTPVIKGATAEANRPATAAASGPGSCEKQSLADPRGAVEAFVTEVEKKLLKLLVARERMEWVKSTFITHDTEILSARAAEEVMAFSGRKAAEAVCRFGTYLNELPQVLRRKLMLLRLSLSLPAPPDPARRAELASIASGMESLYGKGKYCPSRLKGRCLTLGDMSEVLAKSRKYDELLDLWQGWRTISVPMRKPYARFVELANEGARSLGFRDLGELWRSRYDMEAAVFYREVDRLWQQVRPLYVDLHCYVRGKLQERYGKQHVPDRAPIPAQLLGNMWSQEWTNLYDLVAPARERGAGQDLERVLKAKKVDARGMVKIAEAFFVSLGLGLLPATFWERSMFVKPQDREVVCHASAWDVDWMEDLRIKMCIKPTAEDLVTIHHELGHNYYQRAYRHLDLLLRDSANDGFHEALGDTLALSVTPSYLVKIKLLDREVASDIGPLLRRALEKVAFLPFGMVVDRWRWDVFSGKVGPGDYNKHWWELRTRYQGIKPPLPRSEKDFDPGAKYHVPANVPYTRYFLAAILQFQFHRALCRDIGHKGPLQTCSIHGSKEAGKKLQAMMELGLSRPWPEALRALTGEEQMDATAMLAYFSPLHEWLRKQNQGRTCGW